MRNPLLDHDPTRDQPPLCTVRGNAATFSDDGLYRYRLTRRWGAGGCVAWVMLNPSTANATHDDPTIRRCIGFSQAWGYGSLVVVNLFAFRSADPGYLSMEKDPVGPDNDAQIVRACAESNLVMVAWGAHPIAVKRAKLVMPLLPTSLHCLDTTRSGQPSHPLFQPSWCKPRAWSAP